MRALSGRVLLESGQLVQARSALEALIADYQKNFGPDHPKAAELELELARIERAEGHHQAAAQRIGHAAPILGRALVPGAPALSRLAELRSTAPPQL